MLNTPSQQDINCGQAAYTKKNLPWYDIVVTKFSNRCVWRCPKKILINFFKANFSYNHLDIGVGTGYFLQQLHLMPHQQRLALMDLNQNCLDYAYQKLIKLSPEVYQHDIFKPFPTIHKKFDSVSLNYVLHCLPGGFAHKAIVFDNLKSVLNPGGKLFGATILGKQVQKNWLAEKFIQFYNHHKIMDNLNDDYQHLLDALQQRFTHVQITMHGCVALFMATLD